MFTEAHEAPAYGPQGSAVTDRRVDAETKIIIVELSEIDKRSQDRRTTDLFDEIEQLSGTETK